MKKCARSGSVIGGADGPTSVFIAGRTKRNDSIWKKIKNARMKRKREMAAKMITANPHTMEEVIQYLYGKYEVREIPVTSKMYQIHRKNLKEMLILQNAPKLLEGLADPPPINMRNEKDAERFFRWCEARRAKAERVSEEEFPFDFHMYEIAVKENGSIELETEWIRGYMGSCWKWSGDRSVMKQVQKDVKHILKEIYIYYGVTETDIEQKSDRFKTLIEILCS